MIWRAAILAILFAAISTEYTLANAPSRSLQPMPRPGAAEPARPQFAVFDRTSPGLKSVIRPRARPAMIAPRVMQPSRVVLVSSRVAIARSIRPHPRPQRLKRNAGVRTVSVRTQPAPVITRGRRGSVCGIKTIKGEKLAPIPGRIRGCGVSDPVRITSVDGVALSQASIMDCGTAKALNSWVKNGLKPTVGRLGGGVASLKVIAHYSCRTRNSQPGAKISEHGKGRAVDISAVNLKNGSSISVLKGWGKRTQGKLLKKMHKTACGPFGTVLGPGSDKFHRDHFHFDTARYRSGSYCR